MLAGVYFYLMNKFHKKVLESVKVPVEKISFRVDKWGEIATVYYGGVSRGTTIGDDHDRDEFDSFLQSVKQGSRVFVSEAKKMYGEKWYDFVKHRR